MSREPAERIESSRRLDTLVECDSERMLEGGVGRRETPKKSALREREGALKPGLGVSSALASDLASELEREWGLGGGTGVAESSEKGEPKNALVLLPVGEGGGEVEDEAAVYALK